MNVFYFDETKWEVRNRYTDLAPLGKGAYGLVCSAEDKQTKQAVAIKKLARPFETTVHSKRAYREIVLLKHVSHDNVIQMLDVFTIADSPNEINDVYIVTNLMGTDLNNVLKTQALSDEQIVFFTYQMLRGLKYLHSSNIIHRDLKPSNLAVNENCELRIIDFGLSRGEREEMTGYVATRWYRAPEIMLKWMHYSKPVDIWSIGCIIAEMFTHKPLFPGKCHVDQLNRILSVVGFPQQRLLSEINADARTYLDKFEVKPNRANFYEYFSEIKNTDAIDLLDKMLQLDPESRITCEQALDHPFVSKYHDPDDEPEGIYFDDNYENEEHTIAEWKERIYNEIRTFVPPVNMND